VSELKEIEVVNELTKADFVSDQEIRWCPGCGDYSILSGSIAKENFVFVSGIGCSSRLPYYMSTYGFHTLHGRAPAVATGIKIANPDLSVWVITGDGDGLSIGANHLIHALRRNVNINVLLINNRVYGLTKGQYSPTSEQGKITKSSPLGSAAEPINPISFALTAGATFVARTYDSDAKNLQSVLQEAATHRGASFVEIYQNCNIFNDGAFDDVSSRKVKDDNVLYLREGQPLSFGGTRKRAIVCENMNAEAVDYEGEELPANTLVHSSSRDDEIYSYMLSRFTYPDMPIPMGVFKKTDKPCYEELLHNQRTQHIQDHGRGSISDLLSGTSTWVQS